MRKLRGLLTAWAMLAALGWYCPARADDAAVDLRVMTFNIWYGGQQVSFGQVVEAIRAAKADVVGVQEPDGGIFALAAALGWPYVDERLHVISRFPLFDPPGSDHLYTWVEVEPGRIVAVANVHMPATPYGPEAVRDGKTLDEVLTLEKDTRMSAIEPYVGALPKLAADGIPVFLTGDFNSPSYLDWTAATAKARAQVRFPVEWPVSKALADAGLRDSYREAHPDPVKTPGITWTPGYPHPRVKPDETFDRIDFVWTAGKSTTLDSQVVGESGGPDVGVGIAPWPSDHRAVVSSFRVVPAAAPAMLGLDRRRIAIGDDIIVRFHAPGAEDGRVAILKQGGDAAKDAEMSVATGDASDRPSIKFGSGLLPPGGYDAVLLAADGKELARIGFHILAKDAAPSIGVTQATYKPGDPITVKWRNAPGMKFDWIGIYKADDPDLYAYIAFVYANAAIDGTTVLDKDVLSDPLADGDYEVRLLRDDSYVLLATARFTMKAAPP